MVDERHSIPITGSKKKKMAYTLMPVKSTEWTEEEYNVRSGLVINELKRAVDYDPDLSAYTDHIWYDYCMVGTSYETAEPSIIISAKGDYVKALRMIFKKKATDKLYCRSGSSIWRAFKKAPIPQRPPFRLVYRRTSTASDVFRYAAGTQMTAFQTIQGTLCGSLVHSR
ncbi:hypothetical protein PG994_000031 [Apiospora phragmitis]|uniref:Uncharacterized protein n=1 Tax=Apiospora phragmitis TaxID=2905665 RepID=A0ABR1X547_9PEZI